MWGNGNFLVSPEQAESSKAIFDEIEIFATDNLRADEAADILKRHPMGAAPNPWGTSGDAPELNKAFGYTPPTLDEEFDEKEPFDLKKIVEGALHKAMGEHGHFRIERSANGAERAIDCRGQTVAGRMEGVHFTDLEISELRRRCACDDCKVS